MPDADLEALFVETNTFRLASHIYWALWAIVQVQTLRLIKARKKKLLFYVKQPFNLIPEFSMWQAKVSSIDFDYLSYFFLRYNEYKKRREICFSIAREYLSRSIWSWILESISDKAAQRFFLPLDARGWILEHSVCRLLLVIFSGWQVYWITFIRGVVL